MTVRSQAGLKTNFEIDRGAHTIRLTRAFDAPRAQIFDAWTQPGQVACWWDPAGERLTTCEIDLRPGGAFKFVSRSHPEMPFAGTYREIAPPQRLVFEALGATGRVALEEVAGKTVMTVEIACRSAQQLDQYIKNGVDVGTAQTLDSLVAYTRRREKEVAVMDDPFRRPTLGSGVFYKDPWAALDWLGKAFGFERSMVICDKDGHLAHAEMRFGDGYIMLGSEWADFIASPVSVGGKNTQSIHVQLPGEIDAHCEHARAAGAVILQEPSDQFYGDRTYRARDPEGHVWTFAQSVRHVSREEAQRTSGLRIEGWH
jgi:uncharacterized glyoxalase superfamily protein PhnB/uncharacterized protein YndB with AHSA1/START domain